MSMITRPMKAETVKIETLGKVEWPAFCSPKIDGIRLLVHPELGPVTQSFKPLPNHHVRDVITALAYGSYLDGEVYAVSEDGTALPASVFNETQSVLMSRHGTPDFCYSVFDCFEHPEMDFAGRYVSTQNAVNKISSSRIRLLKHHVVETPEEFLDFVDVCIEQGYEGAVIRSFAGVYKSGRSTLGQGWMLKYKNWVDAEGVVVGFEELHHNDNPDERSLLGLAKRSSHKANKVAMGTLGALIVKTAWGELRLGSGFTAAQRQYLWDRNVLMHFEGGAPDLGRAVTFKYQEHGMQDLPRFPIFLRFRED